VLIDLQRFGYMVDVKNQQADVNDAEKDSHGDGDMGHAKRSSACIDLPENQDAIKKGCEKGAQDGLVPKVPGKVPQNSRSELIRGHGQRHHGDGKYNTHHSEHRASDGRFDSGGRLLQEPVFTVFQNGIQIHDYVQSKGATLPGKSTTPVAEGFRLQEHGSHVLEPVLFRNIWAIENPGDLLDTEWIKILNLPSRINRNTTCCRYFEPSRASRVLKKDRILSGRNHEIEFFRLLGRQNRK